MKNYVKLSAFLLCFLTINFSSGIAQTAETKTETFKVYGNCGMCKATIEGALKKKDGIIEREWNVKTKMLKVTYNPDEITLKEIKQKVADVGYDSDDVRAKEQTYKNLHGCCQYDRPKKD